MVSRARSLVLYGGLLAVLLLLAVNGSIRAYSYGNPNEEKMAEAYKTFAAALRQEPPDYEAAQAALDSVREVEMDLHFGPDLGATIQRHLENREPEAAIRTFQIALAYNIDRRLINAAEAFDEYSRARLLLAKARATYTALAPVVRAENPQADEEILAAFDEALEALGNPGLFGVGERPADREAFETARERILQWTGRLFGVERLTAGHTVVTVDPEPSSEGEVGPGSAGGSEPSSGGEAAGSLPWPWIAVAVVVLLGGGWLWLRRRPHRT